MGVRGGAGVGAAGASAGVGGRGVDRRMQAPGAEGKRQLDAYEVSEAVRLVDRLVGNEFCDWYLEIAKLRLYGEDEAAKVEVSSHLLYLLDAIPGLLPRCRPFLPGELGAWVAGGEGFSINWGYPRGDEGARDPRAEKDMEELMETITAIRTLRNELGVPPKREAHAVLVSGDEEVRNVVQNNASLIESLTRTVLTESVADENQTGEAAEKTAVALIPGGKLLIPLAELIDLEQEKSRLQAVISKKKQELSRAEGKLANKNFVSKAPPELVEQEKAKLEQHGRELAELEQQYNRYFGG